MVRAALPEDVAAAVRGGPRRVLELVAAGGGTPLRSGDVVTLVYRGGADSVAVRHWLDIYPPIPEFDRLQDSDLWSTSFVMAPDARFEYKLAIRSHGRQRLKTDSMNPLRADNPWGANSELRGRGYQVPHWAKLQSVVPRGMVSRYDFASAIHGDERSVHLYRPQGAEPVALLLVHDGGDYLAHAGLAKVLDNLIAAGEIAPVAAVLSEPRDRLGEYRAGDAHARHVVEEVLPWARSEVGVVPVFAMGASLGGVASLHAAWQFPGVFAGLILQAGSFVREMGGPFHRGPVFAPVIKFVRSFLAAPGELPPRVHVSCGRFDGLINEARFMAEFFTERGSNVAAAEISAGHDWSAWRDLLRPALMHVLAKREA